MSLWIVIEQEWYVKNNSENKRVHSISSDVELKDEEGAGLHPCAENQKEVIKTWIKMMGMRLRIEKKECDVWKVKPWCDG